MKNRIFSLILTALVLLSAIGCSESQGKASPAEEKAFAGGPPPANYMDAANKSSQAAQATAQDKNAPKAP